MNRELILRCSLWLAAGLNVGGALLFAFPASSFGQFAGLPAVVPIVYRAFTALFILLFGGAYAWLANHRPIVRPLVGFGAYGKVSAFFLTLVLWFAGEADWRSVLVISGDLMLATVFAWCLLGTQQGAQDRRAVNLTKLI